MPTINEVIERVERVKPVVNIEDRDKAAWLVELDNRIWNDVIQKGHKGALGPIGPVSPCPVCGAAHVSGPIPPEDYKPPYVDPGEKPPDPWGICYDEPTDTNGCWVCGYNDALPGPVKSWPEDGDKPLLVGPPHDRVYDMWLISMMDFFLREYSDYNNSVAMFNSLYQEYASWYRQHHMPKGIGVYKNLFG